MMNNCKTIIVLIAFVLNCETLQIRVKHYSVSRINDWADMLLEDMKSELWSTDKDFIRIPDLQAESRNEVGKNPVHFEIFARKGIFGGLVSIKRKNSVSVSTVNGEKVIELVVEIAKTGAHFDDCIVQCGPIKSLQELEVLVSPVGNTLVTIGLSVLPNTELCDVVLHQVRVEEFKNLTIQCDNYCVNSEKELFHNWITDYFNSHVCGAIGSTFATALTKLLKKHNICMVVI